MSEARSAIEAARGWHKIGLGISATALILLFAPEEADYTEALREAYTLQQLQIEDYEDFIRAFIGQNSLLPPSSVGTWADWERNITDFLNSEMNQVVVDGDSPNPSWNIIELVDYVLPPVNGTLADWFQWINSSEPASYYHPDWETATLSASRDNSPPAVVRHFSLRESQFNRSEGEYTFQAFLDLGLSAVDQSGREDWWSEIEGISVHDRQQAFRVMTDNRWIVEGDVESTRTQMRAGSVNDWLRRSGIWTTLSKTNNLGEEVLPNILEHWTELGVLTLPAAISFMERAQSDIGSVSLLGIPIPGELCVIAIPLAYLLVYLSLFLDIRFLRSLQRSDILANRTEVAWMGLYDDRLAVWATHISIGVVPFALTLGLLWKYGSIVEQHLLILGILALAISTTCQMSVLSKLTEARRVITDT